MDHGKTTTDYGEKKHWAMENLIKKWKTNIGLWKTDYGQWNTDY